MESVDTEYLSAICVTERNSVFFVMGGTRRGGGFGLFSAVPAFDMLHLVSAQCAGVQFYCRELPY
jgi:hypothetical protein